MFTQQEMGCPLRLESGDVLTGGLVVGIGASAGGLAAFRAFLANTPADTGMAFIIFLSGVGSDGSLAWARSRSTAG